MQPWQRAQQAQQQAQRDQQQALQAQQAARQQQQLGFHNTRTHRPRSAGCVRTLVGIVVMVVIVSVFLVLLLTHPF